VIFSRILLCKSIIHHLGSTCLRKVYFLFLSLSLHNSEVETTLAQGRVITNIYDCVGYLSARKGVPMSKNKKGNGHHHLTLSDGIYIESEMNIGSTFKSIADTLGKDPSTISKEVRLHRIVPDHFKYKYNRLGCKEFRYFRTCEKMKTLDDTRF